MLHAERRKNVTARHDEQTSEPRTCELLGSRPARRTTSALSAASPPKFRVAIVHLLVRCPKTDCPTCAVGSLNANNIHVAFGSLLGDSGAAGLQKELWSSRKIVDTARLCTGFYLIWSLSEGESGPDVDIEFRGILTHLRRALRRIAATQNDTASPFRRSKIPDVIASL
jgi:hypothetical protein